jgi:two-component system, chemotaxis family, CheB/CheR fusion protein
VSHMKNGEISAPNENSLHRIRRTRKSGSIARGKLASSPSHRLPPLLKSFPIVGLGASAGGLEALEKFLTHIPPDSGIAFVVITHLLPSHVSLLPHLLGKCTLLPVQTAVDGVRVQPNTIYMSPVGGQLALHLGRLHIRRLKEKEGPLRLPIDYFFSSLAEDQKERAIGIVLSGTGSDGTLGLNAIKGVAGMTMAQEPDSAQYGGMPSSAIDTGRVDYCSGRTPAPKAACLPARVVFPGG